MNYIISLIFIFISFASTAQVKFEKVNWNNLSIDQKSLLIKDLKLFIANYERTNPNLLKSKRYSHYSILSQFIKSAQADGKYDCLYGGWPSSRNNKNQCKWPQSGNHNYKNQLNNCSSTQLLCNPKLFGDNICVSFETKSQRTSAFSQCEKKFEREGRNLEEIVNSISPEEFGELKQTIDDVCNNPSIGSQHVTPMCSNLKKKMSKYIPNTYPSGLSYAPTDKLNLVQKEDALEKMMEDFQSEVQAFDKNCPDPNPNDDFIEFEAHKDIECRNQYSRLSSLQKNINAISGDIESIIDDKQALCSAYPEFTEVYENILIGEEAASEVACTASEKANYSKNCFKDIMCFAASSLTPPLTIILEATNVDTGGCLSNENNCVVQALTALVDTLWSTITGVWDLLKMAADASVNWVKNKWNSFWNDTKEVEDKSANAAHQASNLTDQDVQEIKDDKEGWLARTFKGLWGSIKKWLSHDIYCQSWSGTPRMPGSECLKPFDSDCMSCSSLMKGSCALIGAVASEVGMAFFTGGAANAAKHTVNGASKILKASKALSNAVNKSKSLIKIPAKIAAKSGKWVTRSTLVRNVTGRTANFLSQKAKKLKAALAGMKELPAIQKFNSLAGKAYKYSGAKAFVKVNDKAFKAGQTLVDKGVNKVTQYTTRTTQVTVNTSRVTQSASHSSAINPIRAPSKSNLEGLSVLEDIGTNSKKLDALENFKSQVNIDENIARLMDEAHNAPYGYAKNKKILELEKELIVQGVSPSKAKELVRGVDDGSGVLKGGLASEDVRILGKSKIKSQVLEIRTKYKGKVHKMAKNKTDEEVILKMLDPENIEAQYIKNTETRKALEEQKRLFELKNPGKKGNDIPSSDVGINVRSKEQALNLANDLPILDKYGFGRPTFNPNDGWKVLDGNLGKSYGYKKKVGYTKKLDDGSTANIRLDWDPDLGVHYNIDLDNIPSGGPQRKTVNIAIYFECPSGPCSEKTYRKYIDNLQKYNPSN